MLQSVKYFRQSLQWLIPFIEILKSYLEIGNELGWVFVSFLIRVIGLSEDKLKATIGSGVVDRVDGIPAHYHLDAPLLFGGKAGSRDCFLRIQIASVGEWAGEWAGNASPHEVDLCLHVGIEFYFFGHDNFSFLDPLQQKFDIGVLSNVLPDFVHVGCYSGEVPHRRNFDFILHGRAR